MMRKLIIYFFILLFMTACETSGGTREQQATLSELDNWRATADKAYAKQEFEQALNYYKKISEAVPQDAEIWFRIGNTYNRLGDTIGSISSYKEALIRDNTYSKAWYNLSMLQLKIAAQAFQEAASHLKVDDPVYIASIRASEELLELIDKSNKTISDVYNTSIGPMFDPDKVEVIILKQSESSEPDIAADKDKDE